MKYRSILKTLLKDCESPVLSRELRDDVSMLQAAGLNWAKKRRWAGNDRSDRRNRSAHRAPLPGRLENVLAGFLIHQHWVVKEQVVRATAAKDDLQQLKKAIEALTGDL
jgi:hypothetical protein